MAIENEILLGYIEKEILLEYKSMARKRGVGYFENDKLVCIKHDTLGYGTIPASEFAKAHIAKVMLVDAVQTVIWDVSEHVSPKAEPKRWETYISMADYVSGEPLVYLSEKDPLGDGRWRRGQVFSKRQASIQSGLGSAAYLLNKVVAMRIIYEDTDGNECISDYYYDPNGNDNEHHHGEW